MDEQTERIVWDRRLIAAGRRPVYHVTTAYDGSAADVRIRELPLIHVFVPDADGVPVAARNLIARLLDVQPTSFDLTTDD